MKLMAAKTTTTTIQPAIGYEVAHIQSSSTKDTTLYIPVPKEAIAATTAFGAGVCLRPRLDPVPGRSRA